MTRLWPKLQSKHLRLDSTAFLRKHAVPAFSSSWSNRGLTFAPGVVLSCATCGAQLLRQASSISTHKENASKGSVCTLFDGNRPQSVHHVFKILRLHNERLLIMLSPTTKAQVSSIRCFVGQLAIAPGTSWQHSSPALPWGPSLSPRGSFFCPPPTPCAVRNAWDVCGFAACALQLMVRGYKRGLVKFALITGNKP